MKAPDLQEKIVSHLRTAARPVSSRDLAERFLRIGSADEATCHRLLSPMLATVRGIAHRAGHGWAWEMPKGSSGAASSAGQSSATTADAGQPSETAHVASAAGSPGLSDFVALAVDGGGPGGSGPPRVLAYLPVVAGEELPLEHLPSWAEEADGATSSADRGAGLTTADLERLHEEIGDLPIVAHRVAREVEPIRRLAQAAGLPFHPPVVSLARLGHLLLGLKANHKPAELAQALGVESSGPDDCRGRARLLARSFLSLQPQLQKRNLLTLDAVLEFQSLPAAVIDFSRFSFTVEDLKAIPEAPGVYRFLDRDGVVLYVGKAADLRTRVATYFTPQALGTEKGQALLARIDRFAYDVVASELEAILLEAALIQELRPPLNRQFEVHERAAPYGPRLNLIVVLPDGTERRTCTLHLLRAGGYVQRLPKVVPLVDASAPTDASAPADVWETVGAAVASIYFRNRSDGTDALPGRPGPRAIAEEAAALDWQLVASFLRRHKDEWNVLDLDECPDPASAVARLRVLVGAALEEDGRTFAR